MAESEGFLGGLSSGLQQGTNMGYLAMQARAMRENQMRQNQMMMMQEERAAQQAVNEQKKREFDMMNAQLERAPVIFKGLPDSLKPEFYKTVYAPLINRVYPDAKLPTDSYTESIATGLEDFGKLIEGKRKGVYNDDEFLYFAGQLRSKMSKEESDQAGSILNAMPDVMKARAAATQSNRDPQLWGAALDNAKGIVNQSYLEAKYGILTDEAMKQKYQDELDRETVRQYDIMKGSLMRGGAPGGMQAPGGPRTTPAGDPVGDFLKSINAKDTPKNRKWAEGQMSGR